MRSLMLFLWDLVLMIFVAFQVSNLAGYPRIPSPDDDDLLNARRLRQLKPELHDETVSVFAEAVELHRNEHYPQAVQLYESVRFAKLNTGETIDLYEEVQEARKNYQFALKKRKSNRPDTLLR